MVLGTHLPVIGTDAATGIPFPDTTQQPIRQLGILLSASGSAQFAELLYTQRLHTITWRIRQWAKHNLSYLGRCEVARQVLASCLCYHAQFVPVPAAIMARIHRRIVAFVAGQGCVREEQIRVPSDSPPAAVASLPVRMGGSGQVDVRAKAAAMQAKVAAALLHPRRAAWKVLMRANLQRALPGLGEAVLLQQSRLPVQQAVAQGRLSQRHAAYIEGFQQCGIYRHTAHDAMTTAQIKLEQLVGNCSIGSTQDGSMFSSAGCLPAPVRHAGSTTLGQMLNTLSVQQTTDVLVLPPAWLHTLQQQEAAPEWTSALGRWVQHQTATGTELFEIKQDGSLAEMPGMPLPAPASLWTPCCVAGVQVAHRQQQQQHHQQQVLQPPPLPPQQQQPQHQQRQQQQQQHILQQPHLRLQQQLGAAMLLQQPPAPDAPWRQLQQQQQQPPQQPTSQVLYLVGPWDNIRVDPSVWGMGVGKGVLQFTVKHATQRLLQHQCSKKHPVGWVPGVGMRPRLWRDRQGAVATSGGLAELEAAQKRSFDAMLTTDAAAASSSSSQQRRDNRFSDAALLQAYHASWMDPSPARALPRQRAADAAAVLTLQRQQQQQQQQRIRSPAVDDMVDPLTLQVGRTHTSGCDWVAAYRRAGDKQLPRSLREFGWRMLHAGVKVGARRLTAITASALQQQQQQHYSCVARACQQQPQLETLSHAFVLCPEAATLWQWFVGMWQRVQPGTAPPVTDSRLMLLDDISVWSPPADKLQLWTYLRLLLLESVWTTRCSCRLSNSSFTAKAAACRFKAELQQQMLSDWARMGADVRVGSGVPMAWLRGGNPELSWPAFWAKWGALCHFSTDGSMTIAASTAQL
jgi:hypothetical protein